MRLLIIEDDRDAADYLVKAFREVGHVADLAGDGEEGLAHALDGQYDVLIVDRMLPKLDGLTVIGTLRSKGIETPALILSALGQVDDRVKGLRAGGDDYLPKALFVLRAAGAHRGAGAPARRPRGDGLSRRRPRARPAVAPGDPRRRGDRAAAARVPPARISDEACRAGGDPHHAARERVGLSFRSADQRDRRAHFAAALEDRQGICPGRCCIRCAAQGI